MSTGRDVRAVEDLAHLLGVSTEEVLAGAPTLTEAALAASYSFRDLSAGTTRERRLLGVQPDDLPEV